MQLAMNRSALVLALALVCLPAAFAQESTIGGLRGGGPLDNGACLTPLEHGYIHALASARLSQQGGGSFNGTPEKFTFYPMAGNIWGDVWMQNYNDLDPTGGILDWDCTNFTYNGHDATDALIRTFGEQALGVPIFAALDGTVISTHDGEPDMNTSCQGVGNHVIIDHGNSRICYYWHFKTNSILVSPGQTVRAGQELGLTGSSGCSDYPHLHFGTYDNGASIEPFAGPCRTGTSEWVDQHEIERSHYLSDLNVTDADLSLLPGLPHDLPRQGSFVMGPNAVWFWVHMHNQPAGGTFRVRYERPNGTIAFDTGTSPFGAPNFFRFSWWYWAYNVDLDVTGTWHVILDSSGQQMARAPFEVVPTAADIVNRPPNPIAIAIEPVAPTPEDVLICRVDSDLILDDPDYDIVQYHYVWRVAGNVVRDVTTAGRSDVLQRLLAAAGDQVTCTVTPTDGVADGPTVQDSVSLCSVSVFCDTDPNNASGISIDSCSCSANELVVSLTGGPPGEFAYLLVGAGSSVVVDPQGALGSLCLTGAPIGRYASDVGAIDGSGTFQIDLLNAVSGGGGGNLPNPPGGNLCTPVGQTWNFQFWHRNPGAPAGFSRALSVTFQ